MRSTTVDHTHGGKYLPDKNDVEITISAFHSPYTYRGTFLGIDREENRVYIQVQLYMPNNGHSIYGIPIENIIDHKGFVL